mmetsp:Transcript_15865/g.40449  ORF Transcript_15865/g.40449 Transcript_15865/m.40449 type:complete len:328 (-) Transcript_15865:554-1537(-)
MAGAKKREVKSREGTAPASASAKCSLERCVRLPRTQPSPSTVGTTPRSPSTEVSAAMAAKSGTSASCSNSSWLSSSSRSAQCAGPTIASPSPRGRGELRPRARSSAHSSACTDSHLPASAVVAGVRADASSSIWMNPSGNCRAVSTPAVSVWKATGLPARTRFVSHSACAAAIVACPHKSTSAAGVNQRIAQRAGPSPSSSPAAALAVLQSSTGCTKAVSARLFSAATASIHLASPPRCVKQTAAGLPPNGEAEKASTCSICSTWSICSTPGSQNGRPAATASSARPTARPPASSALSPESGRQSSYHASCPCTTGDRPTNAKPQSK